MRASQTRFGWAFGTSLESPRVASPRSWQLAAFLSLAAGAGCSDSSSGRGLDATADDGAPGETGATAGVEDPDADATDDGTTDAPDVSDDATDASDDATDTDAEPPDPEVALLPGTASTAPCHEFMPGETVDMVVDGEPTTKFLAFGNSVWLRVDTGGPHVLSHYAITSANDAPERDPVRWLLLASNDGTTWTELDVRIDEQFEDRLERREFPVGLGEFHRYYLLRMENEAGNLLQLADLDLHGWSVHDEAPDAVAPTAASGLTAVPISRSQIDIAWNADSDHDTLFVIERASDAGDFEAIGYAPPGATSYAVRGLLPGTSASFRVVAENAGGRAAPSNEASATSIALVGTPSNGGLRYADGGYSMTVFDGTSAIPQQQIDSLVDEHLTVYPAMAAAYNPAAVTDVRLTFDPAYEGVAYASGSDIVVSSSWAVGHPDDIDVIVHEGFHVIQAYAFGNVPGWATEGLADYVRYQFGNKNSGACWTMQRYEPGHQYTDAYGVTARFLSWIETDVSPDLSVQLDDVLRAGTYADSFWVEQTGQSVDELWTSYASQRQYSPVNYD